jgi:hypothetical protein
MAASRWSYGGASGLVARGDENFSADRMEAGPREPPLYGSINADRSPIDQ